MKELFQYTMSDLRKTSGVDLPDSGLVVTRASSIQLPRDHSILFVRELTDGVIEALCHISNSLIVVPEDIPSELLKPLAERNLILPTKRPRLTFAKLMTVAGSGVSGEIGYVERQGAFVSKAAYVAEDAVIEPGALVEHDVTIGASVHIGAGAKIRAYTEIGAGSIIRENAVIGSAGFGFEIDESGLPIRIPHFGGVVIGRNVEIGVSSIVCSGTIDPTMIGDNVKVDNLVHIAHNCRIGSSSLIIACSELSGSVTIGNNCWVGPNVSIIEGKSVADSATIGIGSVVLGNVGAGQTVAGSPAITTEAISSRNRQLRQLLQLHSLDGDEQKGS